MRTVEFVIENRSSRPLSFQIEPECQHCEIPIGKAAQVAGTYDVEPITVQLSDDDRGGIFAAIFPGDGEVFVTMDDTKVSDHP